MLLPKINPNKHAVFKIQDVARSANVTRWHSVNCLRYPSIAEHSFLVTMYAREMLKRINPNATAEEKLLLMEYCSFHDLPEVLTGDMATPVKRLLESMFPDGESPLDLIEEELCPEYKELKHRISNTYLAAIAKLADVLEAVKFIYVEGKSQIQHHDDNLKIMTELNKFIDIFENSNSENQMDSNKDKFEEIKKTFNDIINKEQCDTIYNILLERKQNFMDRVVKAKDMYPDFNWDLAIEVQDDILYGKTTQIHFQDK